MIKLPVFILIVIVAMLVIAPFTAYCQDDSMGKTIDGWVASVDPQNSRIVLKSYENFPFSVPSSAKIINKDGFSIRLYDITPGNYATIDYYDDREGHHIVTNMEIEYNK